MYPFVRFVKEMIKFRNAPHLAATGTHVSTHICWPWDVDPWMELNNGRTLTLYDLGRVSLAIRGGLLKTLRERKWAITVAGNSVRYRRRIRPFDRFTMMSRVIGWDDRFIYMEQSLWRGRDCCNHMLLRGAVTSPGGIVVPTDVIAAMGETMKSPPLPDWVKAWIEADALRPWPPEIPADAIESLPD